MTSTHINGRQRRRAFLDDFDGVKNKVETIHKKVTENDGIYDKVNNLHSNAPEMVKQLTQAIRAVGRTNLLLVGALVVIHLIQLLKDKDGMYLKIPGVIEIGRTHVMQVIEKKTPNE